MSIMHCFSSRLYFLRRYKDPISKEEVPAENISPEPVDKSECIGVDLFVAGFPSPLKRAAIRQAIGAYQSWNSSYQKWLDRPKRMRHHKPPLHPRAFNFNPQYDSGALADYCVAADAGYWVIQMSER